jgi:hypothetical protein
VTTLRKRAVELAGRGYTAPMLEAQLISEGHRLEDVKSTLATVTVTPSLKAVPLDATRARARLRARGVWLVLVGAVFVVGARSFPVGPGVLFVGVANLVLGAISLVRARL